MNKKIRAKVAIVNLEVTSNPSELFKLKFNIVTKNKKMVHTLCNWKYSNITNSFSKEFIIEVKC